MKRPYITRKNLIALGIAGIYAFLFIFVALSITATKDTAIAEGNLFQTIALSFGFGPIELTGVTSHVALVIAGLYIVVLVFALIYVRRFQVINHIKWRSWKIWVAYIATLVLSVGLTVGLTFLLNLNNLDQVFLMFKLYAEALLVTTIISVALSAVIMSICLLVVNFKKVNQPYVFFDESKFDDLGEDKELEEEDASVLSSFDNEDDANLNINGANLGGAGAGGGNSLVDGGARELDDREKVFPGLSKIDVTYDGYSVESIPSDEINLSQLVERFRNYLAKEEKLYYDIDTLRIFIAGLNATRLSILEGLSGTGKSSLPRYFAKFVNAEVTFLPVQVTWRDKTSILGYFNDFSKTYNETDFLLRLYEASYNPDRIHVFVLDEMNISRVEYYFADFLSVLEYPSDQWKIRIMQLPFGFVPPAKLEDGNVTIPENSYFVGTANKDDSTFSIADKVYDRSTVIAFDNKNEPFETEGIATPITLSYSKLKALFEDALKNEDNLLTSQDWDKLFKITNYIYDQFEVAFGNRVMNQIEKIVPVFVASGGKKEDALDFILARKILIKLEGRFEEYVKPALRTLLELLDSVYGAKEFNLSRKQINSLIRKL
ncbi:MAG: hypothetical protein K6C32_03570 [Bacilli bacterium]|nr:hypothetical protein [Bacilli bacterium]